MVRYEAKQWKSGIGILLYAAILLLKAMSASATHTWGIMPVVIEPHNEGGVCICESGGGQGFCSGTIWVKKCRIGWNQGYYVNPYDAVIVSPPLIDSMVS